MATVTLTPADPKSAYPVFEGAKIEVRRHLLDFAEAATKKGSNLAATDVIETVSVKAGEIVVGVWAYVRTAMGAAGTATIGDGTDPDGFTASFSVNSTGATFSSGAYMLNTTGPVLVGGKLYTADDTIDVVLGGTVANAGQVELFVLILPTTK